MSSLGSEPYWQAQHPNRVHTSENEKLQAVFSAILGIAKWNLPEFLYHTFRYQDENGKPVHRTTEHAAIVSRFLQGRTKYTPAMVLDAWFRGPDGSISKDSMAFDLMLLGIIKSIHYSTYAV
ncbi:hypothetical protein PILCRDRAFT_16805 [Piloderma croceum F 1598]|uniref:Uncharacterized protein n=1 Tax=Piloderma croceum (strain F 1598) TaxID=765440 RepID=A0A0C3AD58_PILCF|nr:hypothetical protein PILCRDRAFT_16805 [Piloderma croceum F 1598]